MSVATLDNANQTSMANLHLVIVYVFLFHGKLLADCQ